MDKREVLRPYKKQRLGFEGVLVHIMQPNKRNGYTFGLVFASVYAPNEQIEIDHVVIEMDRASFGLTRLELFKRYGFTAKVSAYQKAGPILGILVQQECFMLEKINPKKMVELEESKIPQPTEYIKTRIKNVMLCKHTPVEHTEEELVTMVQNMPNDGRVEEFMNEYTRRYQGKKVDSFDIIQAIYS